MEFAVGPSSAESLRLGLEADVKDDEVMSAGLKLGSTFWDLVCFLIWIGRARSGPISNRKCEPDHGCCAGGGLGSKQTHL